MIETIAFMNLLGAVFCAWFGIQLLMKDGPESPIPFFLLACLFSFLGFYMGTGQDIVDSARSHLVRMERLQEYRAKQPYIREFERCEQQ